MRVWRMRNGISITLKPGDCRRLKALTRDRNAPQKHVWRAEIVLLSADGIGTNEIMRETGKSKTCVWRWQERFMQEGYDGLLRDKTRPSRIPPLGSQIAERVVTLTQTDPPAEMTHWTTALMAKVVGISASSVQRIWRAHGLQQLFNSLDPSPFHERDLDKDAEDYIVSSAEEIAHHRPSSLVIHLPADQARDTDAPNLSAAIHNYFAYRETHERRRLRTLFGDGRIALGIGLGFLFYCALLRELIFSLGHSATSDIIGEGMLIIGWVAMWHPLEIFLYEWVPIRRRCQTLRNLSKIQVLLRAK